MPEVNRSIISMASRSPQEASSSSKGKHRLPGGPLTNAVFHCSRGRRVHRNTQNVGESVLQPDHIQQREPLSPGRTRSLGPHPIRKTHPRRDRTEKRQPRDSGGLQFRFACAELRDYGGPINRPYSRAIPRGLKSQTRSAFARQEMGRALFRQAGLEKPTAPPPPPEKPAPGWRTKPETSLPSACRAFARRCS